MMHTTVSGGCVRFDRPDGPRLHENAAHVSLGVRSLGVDDRGRLVVTHDAPGAIVTMSASADETLVARGIAAGCSGGTGKTVIVLAEHGRALDLREDYARVAGEYANLWLAWVHAVPCSGGSR